ncbi:hypothetical protein MNBD_GAMMA21-2005 [hydrothermal vent metagenome]|uniref:SCP2 domain-containing protein n=1 Tax=hydrothermal vent metagenome TaxID=652676 RepID=A0A3B0ZXN0_9ZZZZ
MGSIFSSDWATKFQDAWNNEPAVSGELAKIGFNSMIGYGFDNENDPACVFVVNNGEVVKSGAYSGQELNWDLRSSKQNWKSLLSNPPSMTMLSTAYTSGKLKFNSGDYSAMLRDLRMAEPFIKSFAVMARL